MSTMSTFSPSQSGYVAVDLANAGSVLYGPYLFSVSGTVLSFIDWLNTNCHPYGRILSKWSPGSREFSAAWMFLGTNDPQGFWNLQETFYAGGIA